MKDGDVRYPGQPASEHSLGIGWPVELAERFGQVPGMHMPLNAGRAAHTRDRDDPPPVAVMWERQQRAEPTGVPSRRLGEGLDVGGGRVLRQRRELGGVL